MKRNHSIMVYLDNKSYQNIHSWSKDSEIPMSRYISTIIKLWEDQILMGNIDPIIDNNFRYTLIDNLSQNASQSGSDFTFE